MRGCTPTLALELYPIALEWYGKQTPQWSDGHAKRMLRQLERNLFPWIGERPIAQMHAMELHVLVDCTSEA